MKASLVFENTRGAFMSSELLYLKQIDWFYSVLPDFIVQGFDKAVLWEDLEALLRFDESKWFVDNSNNMIKVMKGFLAQKNGEIYLYDQFEKNPRLIKEIYSALDGTEEHEGEQMPRKSIFASILLAVTYTAYAAQKKPFETVANFAFSETQRVDSNVVAADSSATAFNLTQQEYRTVSEQGRNGLTTRQEWQTVGETAILHPLALVNVTFPFQNEQITVPFPVIMVKDMAYKAEWEQIDKVLRVGFNVLAIAGGAAALATSGNPIVILTAIADIGLASGDLLVQAFKDSLMQTDWGQSFLQSWEKIYTIGGFAVAIVSAPELIKSLLSAGGGLLKNLHKAGQAAQNFIKQVLVKAILEINIANFAQKGIQRVAIGRAVLQKAPISFSSLAAKRLEEKGVIFARLEDADGKATYTAIYNGELIVPNGTAQELRDSLKTVWYKEGSKLGKELDRLEGLAIQRKIEKRARAFIHKWGQKSASLENLTIKEMSAAIRGYTPKADEIADMIDKRKIYVEIWDDDDYIAYLMDYAKKELGMNDAETLDYAWSTQAFTLEKTTYFKVSTIPERFLTQLVHEGTHALDNLRAESLKELGRTVDEIKAEIGNTWIKEERAFTNEWEFQKAIRMESLEFNSIKEIQEYVKRYYPKN